MQSSTIQTVVFDAVGTLIYPEPAVATVYTSVGQRFGSKRTEREVAGRFQAAFAATESSDRRGDLKTSEDAEFARWRHIVRTVLDDVVECEGCFAELWRHFAIAESWRVFEEVPRVLAALASRGIRLAIASNFDRRLHGITRDLAALRVCEPVMVSSEIGYRKPHPRFFDAVRTALGGDPQRILFVGDDRKNDVAGPESAGFQPVLIDRRSAPGDGVVASLAGILQLVTRDSI